MTIEETKSIIQKIKTFRPFFQTGLSSKEHVNFVVEWHQVLEPYDYEDVNEELIKYFKNGDNIGKIPDIYYITKYLKTTKEKNMITKGCVVCPLCKVLIFEEKFDEHYRRCLSIDLIAKKSEKFYQRKINKKSLLKMNEHEFNLRYLDFVKQITNLSREEKEKKILNQLCKLLEKSVGGNDEQN